MTGKKFSFVDRFSRLRTSSFFFALLFTTISIALFLYIHSESVKRVQFQESKKAIDNTVAMIQITVESALSITNERDALSSSMKALVKRIDNIDGVVINLINEPEVLGYPKDVLLNTQNSYVVTQEVLVAGSRVGSVSVVMGADESTFTDLLSADLVAYIVFTLIGLTVFMWSVNFLTSELEKIIRVLKGITSGEEPNNRCRNVLYGEIGDLQDAVNKIADQRDLTLADLEDQIEFATRKMNQEKSRSDQANEFKSLFISRVSHELRQPIQELSLFTERLSHTLDKAQMDKEHRMTMSNMLNTLSRYTEELSVITDSILDIHMLQKGKVVLADTHIDVVREIEELIDKKSSDLAKKKLYLDFIAESQIPTHVNIDHAKFLGIAKNLIGNAIKFTPSGGVVVRLAMQSKDKNGTWVVQLKVEDTGIGISTPNTDKLFDDFYRDETGEAASYPGNGLGLAIVKGHLELMGGSISVDSKPGEGATFTAHIPVTVIKHKSQYAMECTLKAAESLTEKKFAVINSRDSFIESITSRFEYASLPVASYSSVEELLSNPQKFDVLIFGNSEVFDVDIEKVQSSVGAQLSILVSSSRPECVHSNGEDALGLMEVSQYDHILSILEKITIRFEDLQPESLSTNSPMSFDAMALIQQALDTNPLSAVSILSVDDYCETLPMNLMDLGADVDHAKDLAEAAGFIASKPYDIILLDFQLGEHTGLDVIERARSSVHNRDTTIIGITAADTKTADNTEMSEFRDKTNKLMEKPIRSEDIVYTIRSFVHNALEVEEII